MRTTQITGRRTLAALAVLAFALGSPVALGQGGAGAAAAASSKGAERPQRASRIIGMDVLNRQGEKVGDVEDILLDRQGNAALAVVSTGGFLGVGERLNAVPWRALQPGPGADTFLLDIDKERLARAPGFDAGHFPDPDDAKWIAENRRHFPAATGTATMGREVSPGKGNRHGERPPGTSTGRPPVNDIGPTGTTTGRSGNAAGAGSTTPDRRGPQTPGGAPGSVEGTGAGGRNTDPARATQPAGTAPPSTRPAGGADAPSPTGGAPAIR